MKKTLLILALPFLTATAFAQTAVAPQVQAADNIGKTPTGSSTTRAEVKAEAAAASKNPAGKGETLTVPPPKTTSGTTRMEVKQEVRDAAAAGDLKKNGALDSIKTGPSGNSTTRMAVKDEMKADKKAKRAMRSKKAKMKPATEDVNAK